MFRRRRTARIRKPAFAMTRRDVPRRSRRDPVPSKIIEDLFRRLDNHLTGDEGPVLSDALQESGFPKLGKELARFIRLQKAHGHFRRSDQSGEEFVKEGTRLGRMWMALRWRILTAIEIIENEKKYGPVKWYVRQRDLAYRYAKAIPVWEIKPGSGVRLSYTNPPKPGVYLPAMRGPSAWFAAIPEEIFARAGRGTRFRIGPGAQIFVSSER